MHANVQSKLLSARRSTYAKYLKNHTFVIRLAFMIQLLKQRLSRLNISSGTNLSNPSFPNLLIERLYYADGRHHPDHPLHGSRKGLGYL